MVGLHDSITLSFMITGHTKFSPDSCFGLLKQRFRRTAVNTLKDLCDVVTQSAACNKVEVVGWEDGVPIIPTYDWNTYFAERMNKVTGIKKFQHFKFDRSIKGRVQHRTVCDGEWSTVELVKSAAWCPSSTLLPDVVEPKGLDAKRQWYLYDKIRPFCTEGKDITCPLPSCSKPAGSSNNCQEASSSSPSRVVPQVHPTPSSTTQPPAKKRRVCGNCGQAGHNSRTCSKSHTP